MVEGLCECACILEYTFMNMEMVIALHIHILFPSPLLCALSMGNRSSGVLETCTTTLSAFRWLDSMRADTGHKVAQQLLQLLECLPPALQRHLIACLPEIVHDGDHLVRPSFALEDPLLFLLLLAFFSPLVCEIGILMMHLDSTSFLIL